VLGGIKVFYVTLSNATRAQRQHVRQARSACNGPCWRLIIGQGVHGGSEVQAELEVKRCGFPLGFEEVSEVDAHSLCHCVRRRTESNKPGAMIVIMKPMEAIRH